MAVDAGEGAWLGLTLDDSDAGCERVCDEVRVLLWLAVIVNEAGVEDENEPSEGDAVLVPEVVLEGDAVSVDVLL